MPRLIGKNDELINIPGPGNFQFSGVRVGELTATEYTLGTIVVDISGSVNDFKDELLQCIKSIISSCKKNQRSENMLIRLVTFNQYINEIHGFKNLSDIDVDAYEELKPSGYTALFDATFNAIGATLEYAKRLISQDFSCNGVVYIITDGMNNMGKSTAASIADKVNLALRNEIEIESLTTILIGLQDPNCSWSQDIRDHLELFYKEAQLTQFIDVGQATPDQLAKLANWVSESISSQSQSLLNGTASQTLTF